ncbi:MAG: amino acid adenylation domain-containing protein [Actinophytocola sp.]|uniref:non-ribosomal peptide synthetase n=1 Tax=Actinophytocola sp. TaxID=1872138 RepID=UPI003D6C0501
MTTTDGLQPVLADLARANIKVRLVADGELEIAAPRGALTPQIREQLALHKPSLVRWLSTVSPANQVANQLPVVTPDPSAADEPFPLSDLQTSFLIGSAAGLEYHVRPHQYMEFDVDDLDVDRFYGALNRNLLRQRDNLTVLTDDMQLRRIQELTPLVPRVHDFRELSDDEAAGELARLRESLRRRQLPLDTWPWFDVQVSLRGAGTGRIHYNNNNFYSDGVGTNRFLKDVFALYEDPGTELRPLRISARDCVLALAETEESDLGARSRQYWCDRIPDWPGPPPIPTVAGAGNAERSELSRRELVVTAEDWVALQQKGRGRGLTPSTVMYAIYAEALSKFSGSRHFLLNNMVTHRMPMHPDISHIVGNFAALYPLEVDWRGEDSFVTRARRLAARVQEDLQHLHWSGVRVLQALNQHRRAPGRAACPFVVSSGLFMGSFDRPVFSTLETPQVLVDCQFWAQDDEQCWIAWDVIESAFPPGLMDAMFGAFGDLVVGLARDDAMWDRADFDLLPAAQRQQRALLNEAGAPVPPGLLHEPIQQRARQDRDRVAVRSSTRTLSYGEVGAQADRLAAALHAGGIEPGSLVLVVLPKGWEQVVAVAGVLAAGGAYVPVDPEWPDDRIRHLAAVTDASHLITSRRLSDRMAALAPVSVHAVEEPGDHPSAPGQPREPQDLAYVIYTSGSTGTPKGAALDHRGPLNTIADINSRFDITADDVVFGISSLCFDLSVYDVFGTAHAGGTLVLPAPDDTQNPAAWVSAVREHGVTVWNSVPALMHLLVEEAEESGTDLPSLRVVLLSGDWVPVDLPDRIRRVAPNARVISLGGATEASIWSIYYPVEAVGPEWTSIPYGRPMANQTWHVLDSSGADAPTWVPGELYIGGIGLAVGYWHDSERTAASFVTHPRTGERLYRTGDLGRYLPSGDIEFLGRADFQVKIQGFRVELGEIEHVLGQHPAVRRALVAVRDTSSGRQLAALVVPADGQPVADAELREFLAARLPRYMVPATIGVTDRLPLTANGKVDRRALDELAPAEPATRPEFVAPRTPLEEMVAAVWSEVLDVRPIGMQDDFFELGGQSFAGLRVISQIARRVGRRIPLGALLTGRTVAALCEYLEQASSWSALVPMRKTDTGAPVFLVHPAGGSVLCYRSLAERIDADVFALQAPGPDAGRDVPCSVAEFAAEYVDEIRRVRPAGPYVLGGWSSGAVIAAEVTRRLEQLGEKVRLLVVLDSPVPLPAAEVDEVTLLLWFLEDLDLGFHADEATEQDRAELLALPSEQRLAAGMDLVARRTGESVDVDDAALAHAFEVFSGVVRACRTYESPQLAADVVVLRAASGRVSEFTGHPNDADDDWGWQTTTTGQVTAQRARGSHYTLLADDNIDDVAAALAEHLRETM